VLDFAPESPQQGSILWVDFACRGGYLAERVEAANALFMRVSDEMRKIYLQKCLQFDCVTWRAYLPCVCGAPLGD